MYADYFRFKENPFKLVPNPAYLFLSRSHEEALAHLRYATIQGDGFALITGEVGTGKTTLARAFLEDLDETIASAYIFNPSLDSVQLLKAINDEFGIDATADSTKGLVDELNRFLIEKNREGKKAILLIDEAQNLSKPVLEQVRLLSNLETHTAKLFQIVLIGQPELARKLESYELRQLGQRITLSYQLIPLSFKESVEYIRHRMHIASKGAIVNFSRGALRVIHAYAGGIPRRINIAADRSLLSAFGQNRSAVSRRAAKTAVLELANAPVQTTGPAYSQKEKWLVFALLGSIFIFALGHYSGLLNREEPATPSAVTHMPAGPQRSDARSAIPIETESEKTETLDPDGLREEAGDAALFESHLREMRTIESRRNAIQTILDLWVSEPMVDTQMDAILDDREYFQEIANRNRLSIKPIRCNLMLIRNLDLPAIVGLRQYPQGSIGYLSLRRIEDGQMILIEKSDGPAFAVSAHSIEARCSRFYIVWKDFHNLLGEIPTSGFPDSTVSLKKLLAQIGFREINETPEYDAQTEEAVREIQKKWGIPIDGIVGPYTKIAIYNETNTLEMPHLTEGRTE